MESSEPNPVQEESLASIRRTNTHLIAVLFSFIVSLSLIIGGFIIYLVFNHNSPSAITNLAVDEFCSVAESRRSCISSLSSSDIKPILFTDPIHVYTFSLETAVERLSRVGSILSNNCSTSLRAATVRIDKALAVVRVDPENKTRVFEERGGMVELIVEAMEELRSCSTESTAGTRVHGIELLLRYSRDYLLKYDLVNRRFLFQVMIVRGEIPRNPILEVLDDSCVFWLQYFVMVFLFVLILLRCNFCYIGGCRRRE